MSEDIRIVVVDDHTLFRRGLVGLLVEMEGFQVVGEAANGQDALSTVIAQKPDMRADCGNAAFRPIPAGKAH